MPSSVTPSVDAPDVRAAAAELRRRMGPEPFAAALVLGSGLGGLVEAVSDPVVLPFEDLPGFPRAGVSGHAGRWIGGRLEGRRILVQAGRYHIYEGWPLDLVTAPVRTAAALGTRILLLTNAAGGVRRSFAPGTLVALDDHIDLMGGKLPATDRTVHEASRSPYDPELRGLAARCAERVGVPLEHGVYAALSGPSYETPAEIGLLARLGADLVGMSTAPEATAARAAGMRCLGLSLVTNWAAGIAPGPLDHAEVIEMGRRSAATLERLIGEIVRELPTG
jgi:purine-nucleoside phosphorylase